MPLCSPPFVYINGLFTPFTGSHMISIRRHFDISYSQFRVNCSYPTQSQLVCKKTLRHTFFAILSTDDQVIQKWFTNCSLSIDNGKIPHPCRELASFLSTLPSFDIIASLHIDSFRQAILWPTSSWCQMRLHILLPSWILAAVTTWRRRHLSAPSPSGLSSLGNWKLS